MTSPTSSEVLAYLQLRSERSASTAIRRKVPYLVVRPDGSWRSLPWLLGGREQR